MGTSRTTEPGAKSESGTDPVPDGFVAAGRVLGARGVRGEVKLELLADPSAFSGGLTVTIAGNEFTVERLRPSARPPGLVLAEINDRDQAVALRGEYVLVRETDLKPPGDDRYYHYQLTGLRVVSTEGEDLGAITSVFATPGNDVFVVHGPRGEILVPAIEDVVREIDLESGAVTIEVIPGLVSE